MGEPEFDRRTYQQRKADEKAERERKRDANESLRRQGKSPLWEAVKEWWHSTDYTGPDDTPPT